MTKTEYLSVSTKGDTDIIDITSECQSVLNDSGMQQGVMTIFNPGSTGGLTTIEYEPNLEKDFKDALEIIAPSDKVYEHAKTWNDDNGCGHVRSSLIGPSISVPFVDGQLTLGTWQQIIFCDFDSRPRMRQLVMQMVGE